MGRTVRRTRASHQVASRGQSVNPRPWSPYLGAQPSSVVLGESSRCDAHCVRVSARAAERRSVTMALACRGSVALQRLEHPLCLDSPQPGRPVGVGGEASRRERRSPWRPRCNHPPRSDARGRVHEASVGKPRSARGSLLPRCETRKRGRPDVRRHAGHVQRDVESQSQGGSIVRGGPVQSDQSRYAVPTSGRGVASAIGEFQKTIIPSLPSELTAIKQLRPRRRSRRNTKEPRLGPAGAC